MIEFPITLTSGGSVCLPGHAFALALGYTKNRGVYRLRVDATGEWEGLTIRAFWHVPDGKDPASSLVVDGSVDVPASVTAQPSNGCITFEGSNGTKTVTSADLRYRVSANSGTEDSTEPEPGTPAWQQLVDAVHTDAIAAEQAKTDAQTAASEATTSAGNASQSAQEAASSLQELKDGIANGNFKGEKGDPGDPGPAVALDATLTHEGEAADAKATGDAISAVKVRQNILVGSETGNPVSCDDAFAAPLCGLNVYGKSTQDGTPTPDTPVPIVSAGDGGTIAVKMTGKNLLYTPDGKGTIRGVTITSKNGIISISGTATEDGYVYLPVKQISIHGLAFLSSNVSDATVKLVSASWKVLFTQGRANNTQEVIARICFIVKKGTNYDLNGINVQLELGSTATAYSPYREQLLTLPTPNGLPGIPVTSGGNYTDPQGQQWVCDEVDFGKSVKVQRVGRLILDTHTTIIALSSYASTIVDKVQQFRIGSVRAVEGTKPLCERLPSATPGGITRIPYECIGTTSTLIDFNISNARLGTTAETTAAEAVKALRNWLETNPISFMYALATPIETPLTPAEIAAYKALTAYGPDTVVQAGDGAGVKLEYQRDVNLVIKNLEDAVASMT